MLLIVVFSPPSIPVDNPLLKDCAICVPAYPACGTADIQICAISVKIVVPAFLIKVTILVITWIAPTGIVPNNLGNPFNVLITLVAPSNNPFQIS